MKCPETGLGRVEWRTLATLPNMVIRRHTDERESIRRRTQIAGHIVFVGSAPV
jgi:hypothetical protein